VDCGSSGAFEEFDHNQITECDSFPLRVGCEYLRTIHQSNDFLGNTRSSIEVEGGFVVTSATWPNFNWISYYVNSTVAVGDNANQPTLAIAPGAVLRFAPQAELAVGLDAGGLIADGTTGQITFTSARDLPAAGDWTGISYYGSSIDAFCKLKRCKIEYGGFGWIGNILIQDAVPDIRGDSIGFSSWFGIKLDGIQGPNPDTLIARNTFYACAQGSVGR